MTRPTPINEVVRHLQHLRGLFVVAAVVAAPMMSFAQQPAAVVGFGIFPPGPLGPLPCLQTGDIGGRTDPCSYKLHVMVPAEATIRENEEVVFQIRGGGHSLAIYKVRTDTTRAEIGQFLCPGVDPATINDPAQHACNLNVANANAPRIIGDGHGGLVAVVDPNLTNAHPDNRVWYVPGRFMATGGVQFTNGGTTDSNGELVAYQFDRVGRYVIICMNRSHLINDWMFGFINVVEQ